MEDFLSCNICYIRYDETIHTPRQLPCQHIVCSDCLSHMIKRDQRSLEYIECPTCREKCYRRINEIPKSLVIVQLLDASNGSSSSSTSSNNNNRNNATQNNVPYNSSMNNYPMQNNPFYSNTSPTATSTLTSNNNNYNNPPSYSTQPNYNPYNPYPTSNKPTYNQPPSYQNASSVHWDYRTYLRQIFNEMDLNRDGSITASELQQTLRRAQAGSEFNIKTIELLISRYDANGDKQISFDEFFELFNSLNEEYESFLLTDSDGSGTIDLDEFKTSLRRKGYNFSDQFFHYVVSEICNRTKKNGIQFDNYIRVAARFDYLCHFYHNTPYFQKNSLEEYLRKTFFQDFW